MVCQKLWQLAFKYEVKVDLIWFLSSCTLWPCLYYPQARTVCAKLLRYQQGGRNPVYGNPETRPPWWPEECIRWEDMVDLRGKPPYLPDQKTFSEVLKIAIRYDMICRCFRETFLLMCMFVSIIRCQKCALYPFSVVHSNLGVWTRRPTLIPQRTPPRTLQDPSHESRRNTNSSSP